MLFGAQCFCPSRQHCGCADVNHRQFCKGKDAKAGHAVCSPELGSLSCRTCRCERSSSFFILSSLQCSFSAGTRNRGRAAAGPAVHRNAASGAQLTVLMQSLSPEGERSEQQHRLLRHNKWQIQEAGTENSPRMQERL